MGDQADWPWEEDESPYQRVAEIFRDRGVRTGRVGIEERVRFFLFDGIRNAAPSARLAPTLGSCSARLWSIFVIVIVIKQGSISSEF